LVHLAHPCQEHEDPILGAVACVFFEGVKDWEVKQFFFMGGTKSLNEYLNHNLKGHEL
jgi:hypothetical protein